MTFLFFLPAMRRRKGVRKTPKAIPQTTQDIKSEKM
jgi:hypothetical protein